ncbi:MAG: glycosyltransferase [Planctomycetes bacterium]|nr:glycosyltransferase [Planctomycetota bacterium]
MSRPRITVVTPVRDPHPVHFPQAVESLLAQSMGDFEHLVVEDAGEFPGRAVPRHEVAGLLERFRDRRIRHIVHRDAGIASARNRGLAEARGELVAMLDADDECIAERLALQCYAMERDPQLAVLGGQLLAIDEQGRALGTRAYPLTHEEIVSQMPRFNPIAQPSVVVRAAVVHEAGGYRARTCEDYDLWSRLAVRGARFANHPQILVRYRLHAASMKRRKLRASLRDTVAIKREHWRSVLGFRGHLRIAGECALLCLPAAVVTHLFRRLSFRPVDAP